MLRGPAPAEEDAGDPELLVRVLGEEAVLWAHIPRRSGPFDAQGSHFTTIRGD